MSAQIHELVTLAKSGNADAFGELYVLYYKEMFLNVDFTDLQELVATTPPTVFINNGLDPENLAGPYSTFWFDLCWVVFTVLIISALLNISNMIFKIVLMKNEKQLLNGEEV